VSEPTTPSPGQLAATAVHEPVLAAWSRIEASIAEGLMAALAHGLERHREVFEAVDLAAAPPTDGPDRAERLLRYGTVVRSELLAPLLAVLEHRGPARLTSSALTDALDEAARRVRELPDTIEVPWQEGALAGLETDTRERRIRKAAARVVSSARRAGRPRPLPLQFVAARHLHRVVRPEADERGVLSLIAWSDWITDLERIFLAWSDAVLPALIRAGVPPGAPNGRAPRMPEAEETPGSDPWKLAGTAAATLSQALVEAMDRAPLKGPSREGQARIHRARASLEADLSVAGSLVLRGRNATPPAPRLERMPRPLRSALDAEDALVGRLRLYQAFFGLLADGTTVQNRLGRQIRHRCVGEADRLLDVAATLDALGARTKADFPGDDALEGISGLELEVRDALRPALEGIPASDALADAMSAEAEERVEDLFTMARQAPESLPLRAHDAWPRHPRRRVELRSLPFRDLVEQAFDALRIERVRATTQGVLASVEQARVDIEELDRVASFAFAAARRELSEESDAEELVDEEAQTPEARALALVQEALGSMADSLRSTRASLDADVWKSQVGVAREIATGFSRLFDHVAAGRVQSRVLAARSRLSRSRSWLSERWGPRLYEVYRRLAPILVGIRSLLARSRRRVTAILVGVPGHEAASARSIQELGDRAALSEGLPLVYHRLFALESLADPSLLAGREQELRDARSLWARWRQKDGVPLIVKGRPGSGITSFLRVLTDSLQDQGATSRYVSLQGRMNDEAELAAWLGSTLELPPVTTIDELAGAIFAAPRGSLPDALAIDNLEHAYLRVPQGTDLVERVLTLMAETEPRIFWIGGVAGAAWQVISVAEPTAVSQVDVLELVPLGPLELRTAITTRHRRSGLPLQYTEPTTGRKLLRHRLRRMRDPAAYQSLLEADFFEQLSRTSGGHLGLALYQWLAAADFARSEAVGVNPPSRPDFSILESLTLTQNFTLKAFLEHRTLTLEEHDRIFRLPHHESYQVFESLGNRHLIEALPAKDVDLFSRSEVEERLRYRVRPVLLGAVTAHLKGRNIIH
jgi:hypothetical protein